MSDYVEQKLFEKVYKYLPVLMCVPFLRMVGVCNNLAFGKVTDKSDIDLFIVAKTGRLFFVRILVTILLHFAGVRRHGNKVAGRFCLSFFIDDSYLDLQNLAIKDDIYLAYWVKTMIPVIDDGVYYDFISNNRWVDKYFENAESVVFKPIYGKVIDKKWHIIIRKTLNWIFNGKFGSLIESILKKLQFLRANKKAKKVGEGSSLVINDHILKFHNVDRRQEYAEKWVERFGSQKLTKEKFLELS